MTITADVDLVELQCVRETNDGGSTPYLWLVLLQVQRQPDANGNPTSTIEVSRVGWSRWYEEVLAKGLKSGQWASIPSDLLEGPGASWMSEALQPALIIVAALWDKHDTPGKAVEAGYNAFVRSLTLSVADEIGALYAAEFLGATYQQEIIGQIKSVVENAVHRAIKSNLSLEDELLDTLDSLIGISYKAFVPVTTSNSIQLTFHDNPDHSYELGGELVVVVADVPLRPPGVPTTPTVLPIPGEVSSP